MQQQQPQQQPGHAQFSEHPTTGTPTMYAQCAEMPRPRNRASATGESWLSTQPSNRDTHYLARCPGREIGQEQPGHPQSAHNLPRCPDRESEHRQRVKVGLVTTGTPTICKTTTGAQQPGHPQCTHNVRRCPDREIGHLQQVRVGSAPSR